MISAREQFERDFEDFLKQDDAHLTALYRKLPQAEPDSRIDAAVLAMAHRALNPALVATPLPRAERRRARWLPALGAAAGLVLAAGVALRVGPQIWGDRSDRATGTPVVDGTDSVIEVRPLDAPAAPPPPASPAPPPAPMAAQSMAAKARGEMRAPKPAAMAPEPMAKSVRQEAAAEAPALAAQPSSIDVEKTDRAENGARQPSLAAAPAQAFPGRAQPRSEMDAVERKQAIAAGAWQTLPENAARDAAAGSAAPTAASPATPAAAPGVAAPREKKAEIAATPEAMIGRIRRELRENHRDSALRDLIEFRRRYPDYTLPQDLLELK
ncbi:MAG: hypothetical protein P4L92_22575 [Rudaea sp.]|nr:hypothetical protein [Rudaea sp.]